MLDGVLISLLDFVASQFILSVKWHLNLKWYDYSGITLHQ